MLGNLNRKIQFFLKSEEGVGFLCMINLVARFGVGFKGMKKIVGTWLSCGVNTNCDVSSFSSTILLLPALLKIEKKYHGRNTILLKL
jgi:hypothetical protein